MHFLSKSVRSIVAAVSLLAAPVIVGGTILVTNTTISEAAVVRSISVSGNQRVDADTIRSYVSIKPGKSFSSFDIDESLKQLFSTGLFSDVQVFQSGRTLIVKVSENPTVNEVIFSGNKRLKDDKLNAIVQLIRPFNLHRR